MTASAGTVTANAIGTRNVTLKRSHVGVDADRPAARLEDALEELGRRDPCGRPRSAPSRSRARSSRSAPRRARARRANASDVERRRGRRRDRTSATTSTTSPETMSTACQISHLANADEHLRVDGLRQRVVELPVADLLHQPHHVRLDEGADDAAHEDLDAEQREQLRLRTSRSAPSCASRRARARRARSTSASSDWSSWSAKLTRYWSSFITPISEMQPATRERRSSSPHRRVAPDRVPPGETRRSPMPDAGSRRPASPSPREQLRVERSPTSASIGK